jgi:hypothetical protein
MNYISKKDFFNEINSYNDKMLLYDLIRIYYKITDKIFPNYIHSYKSQNVYERLYTSRKISSISCCNEHYNLDNYQFLLMNNLVTNYEYKKYLRANKFFLKLIDTILKKIEYINYKLYQKKKKEFDKFYNKNVLFWNWLSDNIILNRKGEIKKVL